MQPLFSISKEGWPHKTGGRTRQVAAQDRWPHKTCGRARHVAAQDRWSHKTGDRTIQDAEVSGDKVWEYTLLID